MHPWWNALVEKSRHSANESFHGLEDTQYTRRDTSMNRDAINLVQEIIMLTKGLTQYATVEQFECGVRLFRTVFAT